MVAGREEANRVLYGEGREEVFEQLTSLMYETGATNEEVAHTIAKLRSRLFPL